MKNRNRILIYLGTLIISLQISASTSSYGYLNEIPEMLRTAKNGVQVEGAICNTHPQQRTVQNKLRREIYTKPFVGYQPLYTHMYQTSLEVIRNDQAGEFKLHQIIPGDINNYCPNYPQLSKTERDIMWAHLLTLTAYYGNGFDPADPQRKPPGGLMGLDLSVNNPENNKFGNCNIDSSTVQNSYLNMRCALAILKRKLSASPYISQQNQGASSFWPVLREGPAGAGQFGPEIAYELQNHYAAGVCSPGNQRRERRQDRVASQTGGRSGRGASAERGYDNFRSRNLGYGYRGDYGGSQYYVSPAYPDQRSTARKILDFLNPFNWFKNKQHNTYQLQNNYVYQPVPLYNQGQTYIPEPYFVHREEFRPVTYYASASGFSRTPHHSYRHRDRRPSYNRGRTRGYSYDPPASRSRGLSRSRYEMRSERASDSPSYRSRRSRGRSYQSRTDDVDKGGDTDQTPKTAFKGSASSGGDPIADLNSFFAASKGSPYTMKRLDSKSVCKSIENIVNGKSVDDTKYSAVHCVTGLYIGIARRLWNTGRKDIVRNHMRCNKNGGLPPAYLRQINNNPPGITRFFTQHNLASYVKESFSTGSKTNANKVKKIRNFLAKIKKGDPFLYSYKRSRGYGGHSSIFSHVRKDNNGQISSFCFWTGSSGVGHGLKCRGVTDLNYSQLHTWPL